MYDNTGEFQKLNSKWKEPDTSAAHIRLYLYDDVEKAELREQKSDQRLPGLGTRLTTKRHPFVMIEISHVLTVLVVAGLYMVVIVSKFQLSKPDLK